MKSLTPVILDTLNTLGTPESTEVLAQAISEAIGIEARKQKGPAIESAAHIYVDIYAALKQKATEAGLDFQIQPAASTVFIQIFNRLNGKGEGT